MNLQNLVPPTIHVESLSKQIAASVETENSAVVIDGSMLDGMEEAGYFAAHLHGESAKPADKREILAEDPPRLLAPTEAVELLARTHDQQAQAKLLALTDRMLRAGADVRAEMARTFSDPSTQALSLSYAIGVGEQRGADKAALDELRDVLAELTLEHGRAIRLGLHALPVSAGWCKDAQAVATFQKTCRDVIPNNQSLAKMLSLVIDRFGCKGAAEGVARLTKVVGAEIGAVQLSPDRHDPELARLKKLTDDLSQAKVAMTALAYCDPVIVQVCAHQDRVDHDLVNPADLAKRLLAITEESFVSACRFTAIAATYGTESPTGLVTLLSGMHKVLTELPVRLYKDLETRDYTIKAISGARHEATDAEEAAMFANLARSASAAPGA